MDILTIDFETYYDRQYSLSKMTTEEYVRSEDFEVVGVSVQVNDAEPVWFSGDAQETHQFLARYKWSESLALAHNAMFDAAILTWKFGLKPKGWLDTLSMARALHGTEVGGSLAVLAHYYELGEKGTEVVNALGLRREAFSPEQLARYGDYCCNDTALTYKLFQEMANEFPPTELRLIDATIRMFSEPVLQLDASMLDKYLVEVKTRKEQILGTYDREVLMSNPKFAELLSTLGVNPPTKISAATGKETYAFSKTDEEFTALLEHPNPVVQMAVSARLGTKSTIEETRTERLISISSRGSMPVPLRYYAAHTGRWGGDDKLNLQNLPRGSVLKHSIIAPNGYMLIDSDSSQIEARTLAWLAGQDDLVGAFERNEDVYCIMASAIYGRPVTKADERERFVGKTTILGAGYGMGAPKFQAQVKNFRFDITLEDAKHIITTYRTTYPMIQKLWQDANAILGAIIGDRYAEFGRGGILKVEGKKGIRLPNGLYIKYPNLRWTEVERDGTIKTEYVYDSKRGKQIVPTRIYGGKVVENVCQALARIIIGDQLLMIQRKYKVAMTVHDAITAVVPEDEVERAKEFVEICMRLRPSWCSELPLNCEAGYAKSYGGC